MSHLFLSHLSEDNNHPRLVQNFFANDAGSTQIIVAGRKKETKLYHIRDVIPPKRNLKTGEEVQQLSLWS
jgi:hypothetical protein